MRSLMAALVVAGVGLLVLGYNTNHHAGKTPTTTPTSTTKVAPPVAKGALKGLLLDPEQVNAVMGATDMTVTRTRNAMTDDSATMEPRECLAVDGTTQEQIYATSGFTAMQDQTLQDGDKFTHFAEQAVVLFPTAQQADAFFAAAAKEWPTCHKYTHTQSGTKWHTGPVSNEQGTLSTVAIQQDPISGGWACGRALLVRNNVMVDVNTCTADPADTAVVLARQIGDKIPTQ